jgi:ABC-type transport system substrate-binding protein
LAKYLINQKNFRRRIIMFSIKRVFISLVLVFGVVLAACAPVTPVPVQNTAVEAPVTPIAVSETEAAVVVPETEAPVVVPETEAPVVAKPQTIIVALSAAPLTMDPADHRERNTETVIRNMFDGLVTRDTVSNVYNELAESFKWQDDKTLEITLRQGVKFHNGVDMTADDVIFTTQGLDRAA